MSHEYTYDISMFRDTFETRFTYLNGFLRNVSRFGSRPALFDPHSGRRWTYRELNAEANRLAHALRADGVGKNDVVMFTLLNSPEFVFCYLAAHKIGAIACPVNYRQGAGEIALVIDDSTPKAFIYDAEFGELSGGALDLCESKPAIKIVVGADDAVPAGQVSYADYVADQPENDPPIDFDPHIYDETTRLYTSGTTNRPKGVPLNNINEVLSAHDVMMHFPLGPTDRTMNMTPWFHRGGIHSGGPCPTLYAGGEVVILRDFAPKRCLNYAAKYNISFLIGVPTIIAMLARTQERTPYDLSALRGIVTMGAPFEKSAFCYYNNPEMTEQKFYKGFLYTGDVGTWDENEFVTVRGRKDDMIVSAGENIYPPQIEAVLNDHPKVAESAVIGAPDKLRGEVVAAYVVPSDPSLTVEELKEYCTNSPVLSSYKWPRIYNIVDSLPHTATGKIMHRALRNKA